MEETTCPWFIREYTDFWWFTSDNYLFKEVSSDSKSDNVLWSYKWSNDIFNYPHIDLSNDEWFIIPRQIAIAVTILSHIL